ncbi:MAG: hypothetical protein NVS3B16_11730 [Vulcanimicrobiaceae bacterium]
MSSTVPQRSLVTPLARTPEHLDLFVVGNDGGIYSAWWDKNTNSARWNLWFRIGRAEHNVPTNSVVTAIARNPNQIDLFVVGHDGGIYSTWWNPADGWESNHNWFRIGPAWANVPTRSVVTAVARNPNQIDLFVVGHNGGIYSTWWNPSDGWDRNHNWFRIGPDWANVPQRSVVAAVARNPSQLDLFVVGHNGGIYSTWWNPSDGWENNHNWFRIGPDWANVPTNSVVTAVARKPEQLDLFVVGHNGGIYSTWWNPNDGWERNHNWFRIGPDWANVPQRSVVSAVARVPEQLDLFVVGHNGGIYSTWWNPNDGWDRNHNWFRIGPDWANVPTNSVVTAVARKSNQLDLFVVGHNGGIYSTWWNPNDGWERNHNWFRIVGDNCVRLHVKILVAPTTFSVAQMLASMRQVYEPNGIRVELVSTENLNLPALLDVNVGTCSGTPTAAQGQLFNNRNNAGANDVVVYFVRTTQPQFNGCATFPAGKPGAVVVQGASTWTLAHEVGHVLGLNHVDDPAPPNPAAPPALLTRLMTGRGTFNITKTPPDLVGTEVATMRGSSLIDSC